MAGNPPITHVLSRLAQQWHMRRRKVLRLSRKESRARDEAEDALDDHPFPRVCERFCTLTGLGLDELMDAATRSFHGCATIVDRLLPWEGERTVQKLYSDLASQFPDIAMACGLPARDVPLDDTTVATAKAMHSYVQSLAAVNTVVHGWTVGPSELPIAPPNALESPPALADVPAGPAISTDTTKKISRQQPDNVDVRDLCHKLSKNRNAIRAKKKFPIDIAREHTREQKGSDAKAQNLMRQARRFRHLWE